MGLIKLLFHGKEIDELEEVLKVMLDKMRSIYNPAKETSFLGLNKRFYENIYGYGELIKPRTDISFSGDILDKIKEMQTMTFRGERVIILKRVDYNNFNAMSAEFTYKANRYIQLLQKVETSMPTSIRNVIKNYQDMACNFYYSYIYVVE